MKAPFRHKWRRGGFTLPEAMAAVVIVSIACTAMLLSVAQSLQASGSGIDKTRANLLAQDLMNEISPSRWADPMAPTHWGPEEEETRNTTRAAFNDLDDYDGWSGPPQTRDGVEYNTLQQRLFPDAPSHEYKQYTCSVRVEYVTSTGQVLSVGNASPFRRVTVKVTRDGEPPHKIQRIFQDTEPLLGRANWFDPNVAERVAEVQIVP